MLLSTLVRGEAIELRYEQLIRINGLRRFRSEVFYVPSTVSTTVITPGSYMFWLNGGKWFPFVCCWSLFSLASVHPTQLDGPS
jgi:hypothetical protein